MDSRFVVIGLFPAQDARVSVTNNPSKLFSSWRSRHGPFVPLAIHRIFADEVQFFSENVLRLPTTLPIAIAAGKLRRLSIDAEMRPAFRRQMKLAHNQLGPQVGVLLELWVRSAATGEESPKARTDIPGNAVGSNPTDEG